MQVRRGRSDATAEATAVRQLAEEIACDDALLTVFFCSSRYNLDALAGALRGAFRGPIMGCTTAGEIDARRYGRGGIVGFSIAPSSADCAFSADVQLVSGLGTFSPHDAMELAQGARRRLEERSTISQGHRHGAFALTLIDGLSMLEEQTVAFVHEALHTTFGESHGVVPLIGGSAGDDLRFEETFVYVGEGFVRDAFALCVVETNVPFRAFKMQHVCPTEQKLVITAADPERRRVMEIDGAPAAEVYAELLGVTVEELTPEVFSSHPVLLRIGGENFVRAIQRVEADGSLVFYCAIDNGLVLTLAKSVDLLASLDQQLTHLERELGTIDLVIGCDCILRGLEIHQRGIEEAVVARLGRARFVGFSTYGEQFDGVHVNQTLTGIALGRGPRTARGEG